MAVARRLTETDIEAAAARAAHVRPHALEDPGALFVRVEAIVQEGAQEAAALRSAEADGPLHHAGLLQVRDIVADGRRTESGNCRILAFVDHLIDAAGHKTRLELNAAAVLREAPLAAWDHGARAEWDHPAKSSSRNPGRQPRTEFARGPPVRRDRCARCG